MEIGAVRILWVRSDLLHPTWAGGQISSFEIVRRLHQRHEIHFIAYERDHNAGGVDGAAEYCTRLYPVAQPADPRNLRPYALEVARAFLSKLPYDARGSRTPQMRQAISNVLRSGRFDACVCEFASMAPNLPDLGKWVIFLHNVNSVLFQRRSAFEPAFLVRRYASIDARRMASLERRICHRAAHVIAISEHDADTMRTLYSAPRVTALHIGVDADFFSRAAAGLKTLPRFDLVFVGSMQWLPNVDAVQWFAEKVLPLIRQRRPQCTVAIVGQQPDEKIVDLARRDSGITVTGTVDDIRPWLWGGSVFIVPIRYGSGVRNKILQAMAAGIPVVSTTVGAEGLPVTSPEHLQITDDPARFAESCLLLLDDPEKTARLSVRAESFVRDRANWDRTAKEFEGVLRQVRERLSAGNVSQSRR